jgi:Trp operon repressor
MNDTDFTHAVIEDGDPYVIARPILKAARRIRLAEEAIRAALSEVEGPAEPGPYMRAMGRTTDFPSTGDKGTDYGMMADHMLQAQCAMLKDALGAEKAQPFIEGLLTADKDEKQLFDLFRDNDIVQRIKRGEMSPREITEAVTRRVALDRPKTLPHKRHRYAMTALGIGFAFALLSMWLDSVIIGVKPGALLNGAMIGLVVSIVYIAKARVVGGAEWEKVRREWLSPKARAAALACTAMYATAFTLHFIFGFLRGWAGQ